jgi:hypothetical protein
LLTRTKLSSPGAARPFSICESGFSATAVCGPPSAALFSHSGHRPADKDHPCGHGKIEFLSAWFEGGLILLAGVFIVIRTIDALWTGELLREQALDFGLLLVVLAMVGNAGTGKTHLATALAVEACGRGKRVRSWRVTHAEHAYLLRYDYD